MNEVTGVVNVVSGNLDYRVVVYLIAGVIILFYGKLCYLAGIINL